MEVIFERSREQDAKAMRAAQWLHATILSLTDVDVAFVREDCTERYVRFSVTPAKSDMGKLIGMRGHTARAIRTLLCARGGKDGMRYELEITGTEMMPKERTDNEQR
jgi:predicted RNA-binding protein YlqC (UPF0109 family)